jgi:nitroreductase
MTLAAYECGVGSCIIGSAKIDKLKELLDISEELDVVCAVGFGYPTHESRIVNVASCDVKYYLDENKNYLVPKREIKDTVTSI